MPGFCNVEITNMSESIHHNGIIERIEGDIVYVRIVQQSACAGCHAQAMCSAADRKDKIIEVPDRSGAFRPGEEVSIEGRSSMGLQAVFLAFVVPLILVLLAIIAGTETGWGETASGLTGLIVLCMYYGILYLLRDKLKKRFIFTLKKLN